MFKALNSFFKRLTISTMEWDMFLLSSLVIDNRKVKKTKNKTKLFFLGLLLPFVFAALGAAIVFVGLNSLVAVFLIGMVTFFAFLTGEGALVLFIVLSPVIFPVISLICIWNFVISLYYLFSPIEQQSEIRKEVSEFYRAQRIRERKTNPEVKHKYLTSEDLLSHFNSMDINPLIRKYIEQRMYKEDKTRKDHLNYFLLLYASTLPLDRLSVDGAKQVIQSGVNIWSSEKECAQWKMILPEDVNFLQDKKILNSLWGEMTENQVKNLLTNYFSEKDYLSLIKAFLEKKDIDHEAKRVSLMVNDKRRMINEDLKKITSTNNQFYFSVPQTSRDYKTAREDFKNCVNGYFENKEVDILCLYEVESNKPVACVSVSRSYAIVEIKAPGNASCSSLAHSVVKESLQRLKGSSAQAA